MVPYRRPGLLRRRWLPVRHRPRLYAHRYRGRQERPARGGRGILRDPLSYRPDWGAPEGWAARRGGRAGPGRGPQARSGDVEEAIREAIEEGSKKVPSYQRLTDYAVTREPLEQTQLDRKSVV